MGYPISNTNNNKFSGLRPEGSKINTVVITYSVAEGEIHKTIDTLYDRGTSIHYTIRQDGWQDQHHLESSKAFYAGKSSWHGHLGVNDYAIGIMLINDGEAPFSDAQIDKLVRLLKDIDVRYETNMEIVGLGEVALDRHIAPGKLFPWAKLAEHGFGKVVSVPETVSRDCKINPGDEGEEVTNLQLKLKQHGYGVELTSIFDELTAKTVAVFYGRYIQDQADLNCWNDAADHVMSQLLGQTNSSDNDATDKVEL